MDPFEVSIQHFNMFAGEYATRFKSVDAYQRSLELFCMAIEKTSPSLLDLACGPGNFTRYLKQRFPASTIMAIDLAPNMLEIARSLVSGVDFRCMDIRNISGLQCKFDAIICSFGLPFLTKTEAEKLISDCAYLLLQGGSFLPERDGRR
jgi:trans-aconitate methyltransferase